MTVTEKQHNSLLSDAARQDHQPTASSLVGNAQNFVADPTTPSGFVNVSLTQGNSLLGSGDQGANSMQKSPLSPKLTENEKTAFDTVKAILNDQKTDGEIIAAIKKHSFGGYILDVNPVMETLLSSEPNAMGAQKESFETPQSSAATITRTKIPPQKTNNDATGKTDPPTIDISNDDKDVQTGVSENSVPTISKEDMELSKAIEESMRAQTSSFKMSQIEDNPYERERVDGVPVGLKNIGNSCYLSVVIQALFHLPAFRNRVLQWKGIEKATDGTGENSSQSQQEEFMIELRKLFALLLTSTRKYADPTKVFNVLQKHETQMVLSNGIWNNQQDVSEFTHRLLDWIEQAFKKEDDHQDNVKEKDQTPEPVTPVRELFYGSKEETKRSTQGKTESRESEFAQYPLQVAGYDSLHDSIEDSLCPQMETPDASSYEHWLTKLPPVLIFELGRFHFNQERQQTEKLHSQFSFPKELFMDRYLSANKDIVTAKRNQVKTLRTQKTQLKARLDQYEQYGSGMNRIPLANVLESCLEFVHASRARDIVMVSPASSTGVTENLASRTQDINMVTVGESGSGESLREPSLPSNSPPAVQGGDEVSPMETDTESGAVISDGHQSAKPEKSVTSTREATPTKDKGSLRVEVERPLTPPHPGHVSESEQTTFQECLNRWKAEVDASVRRLKAEIGAIQEELDKIYEVERLLQHPFRLHSVLVHQGQASTGHYWSYVYDGSIDKWRKFDDTRVSESDWDSLVEDSMGEKQAASAYCLIYVDCNKPELFKDISSNSDASNLPVDLQDYVTDDATRFAVEKFDWDDLNRPNPAPSPATSLASSATTEKQETSVEEKMKTQTEVAIKEKLWIDFVTKVCSNAKNFPDGGLGKMVEDVLLDMKKSQLCQVRDYVRTISDPKLHVPMIKDPRSVDICSFAALMEDDNNDIATVVCHLRRNLALNALHQKVAGTGTNDARIMGEMSGIWAGEILTEQQEKIKRKLVNDFHGFREAMAMVNYIIKSSLSKKFSSCLDVALNLVHVNETLEPQQKISSLLVWNLIRYCFMEKIKQDMAPENYGNMVAPVNMYRKWYPLLNKMATGKNEVDNQVMEQIISTLCVTFNPDTPGVKLPEDKLSDLLSAFMEKDFSRTPDEPLKSLKVTLKGSIGDQFLDSLKRIEESCMVLGEPALKEYLQNDISNKEQKAMISRGREI